MKKSNIHIGGQAHTPESQTFTQIYVLCRDRLDYAREAISSALTQDIGNVEVVVSDNSDFDAVGQMISSEFPNVTYIRRSPVLGALSHFRTVIEESNAEYVVLFHDDDILDSCYVRAMHAAFAAHPEVVAVGCNAKVLRDTTPTESRFMTTFAKDVVLTNAEELLDSYLKFNKHRAAPFPGYMYRRTAIESHYLNSPDGGKHADVTFLMNVIHRGNILWLAEPLMQYRIHGSNDSAVENVGHRLRLLRFIYKNTNIRPHSQAIQEFKFRYWARWWRSTKNHSGPSVYRWRKRIVFHYLCRQALFFAITKPGLWSRIISGAR